MRRALWLVPLVCVFALAGVGLFRARPSAELGRPAPAFELPLLRGPGDISLADLHGRPTVINFWASWCEPCKEEAPGFARAARELGAKVNFLGVTMLDGRDPALAFVRRYGIDYPSVRDTRGVVAKRYLVTGVPETAFVDARGRLVGKYIGAFKPGELERAVRRLLALRPGSVLRFSGRGDQSAVP